MTLKIVTDSASDVPTEIAEALNITVIPAYINIGADSYIDGIELSRQAFFDNLASYTSYPTTAAPAVGIFTETYERLAREGATEILSMHIADTLSNFYNAARLGAAAAQNISISLFNTKQVSLGAGLLVIKAAEMAAKGLPLSTILSLLSRLSSQTRLFGVLDSLDSLRRSGRVNWAAFGLGTLLQIKPILMISDGAISVLAKVRTHKRAISQLLTYVQQLGPLERLTVVHVNAPEAAGKLKLLADAAFAEAAPLPIMAIGPAVGTHLGVGAVGFACIGTTK
ncbi:MAG: DegV family protein [Anaerolineales bacterium]|nr:DegV family protein [Anaerolineales bacterium]